jgi:alpha-glucosidase
MPDAHHAHAVDAHESDPDALLHRFRRFLAWRHRQPALVGGSLTPVALSSPLVGYTREAEGQRVLAVFNLSESAVDTDLSAFGPVLPLTESGFVTDCQDGRVTLPPHGVLFAAIVLSAADVSPVLERV